MLVRFLIKIWGIFLLHENAIIIGLHNAKDAKFTVSNAGAKLHM